MSWVREAVDDAASKSFEELFPTAYRSSTSDLDMFWGICPNDVPFLVKQAVEAAVRRQAQQSSLTCAVIRLETLGAYYSQDPTRPNEPIGHFAIYLGTTPANTELKSHLPTDYGIPTEPQPKPPSSSATSTRAGASPPRNPTADDPNAAEHKGTRTPSIRDIEKEYSGVEDRSKKPGRRLSRLAGDLANWMHVT